MPIQSINPATGESLRSFPALTDEALQGKIARAAEAFGNEREVPGNDRIRHLRKLSRLFSEDAAELARTVAAEAGKPLSATLIEIQQCARLCDAYADTKLMSPELLRSAPDQAYVQRSPRGVILAVMPQQLPLLQPLRFALPSLIAGNAVLLKHTSDLPQCALALERLLRRSGFAAGMFTSLLVEDHTVETVLNHPQVAGVRVVGTEAECRALAAQAGWLLKPCRWQVQGCGVMVVMPSADVEATLNVAALGLANGEGQNGRLIVHAELLPRFTALLCAKLEALRIGYPEKVESEVGPLSSPRALKTLEEQIQAAVSAGGRVLTGGTRMVGKGCFFEPTLLGDVPATAAVSREPLYGPAGILFRAGDTADAIRLANLPITGPTVSVWTREPLEQQELIDGLQAHIVALNGLPGMAGGVRGDRPLWRDFVQESVILVGQTPSPADGI